MKTPDVTVPDVKPEDLDNMSYRALLELEDRLLLPYEQTDSLAKRRADLSLGALKNLQWGYGRRMIGLLSLLLFVVFLAVSAPLLRHIPATEGPGAVVIWVPVMIGLGAAAYASVRALWGLAGPVPRTLIRMALYYWPATFYVLAMAAAGLKLAGR